ncbi:MAG TPA: P-type conjugative transfer protein TrbG [Alphaproteobacteria bacterium]|nr:P-type conjugative transfer protein TrbG [Alphaproteobacteria bacterium]
MIRIVCLVPFALALAACSGRTPPPAITYDAPMTKAEPALEPPKPVEIVAVPQPLPLPGQLKPMPSAAKAPEPGDPLARVRRANAAAKVEPVRDGYINAIQIYPYVDGALYQLYAAPLKVTDIALQEGEELVSVAAGDTVRWTIGDTESGQGGAKRVHILIKPTRPGLDNDLVINTSRRTYHLETHSNDGPYMAAISWGYPQDQLAILHDRNTAAETAAPIAQGLDLERLRFRYEITGDEPPWRPLRAFDDGEKAYIEFPAGISQGEMPPLFVVGPTGETEIVNYRVKGRYYIVDRLFGAAELRLGADPQQVVRISRTDAPGRRESGSPS